MLIRSILSEGLGAIVLVQGQCMPVVSETIVKMFIQ